MTKPLVTFFVSLLALAGCQDFYPGVIQPVSQNLAYADQVPKAPGPGERLPTLEVEEEEVEEVASAPVEVDGTTAKVTMAVQNGLAYPYSEIRIPAGVTQIEFTLEHQGTVPVTAMGHNVVFLTEGTDPAAFSTAAAQARENGYIPPSMKTNILANTKLLGGGESDTIQLAVPAPGSYDYLCSFAGHYPLMKGKLIIEG
ncbi:MAG: plastocyanin/azurin family copper-binding protein [Myxococcota bacterium]